MPRPQTVAQPYGEIFKTPSYFGSDNQVTPEMDARNSMFGSTTAFPRVASGLARYLRDEHHNMIPPTGELTNPVFEYGGMIGVGGLLKKLAIKAGAAGLRAATPLAKAVLKGNVPMGRSTASEFTPEVMQMFETMTKGMK